MGRIRRTHGVRGDVVVEPYTDAFERLLCVGCRVVAGDTRGDVASPRADLHISAASQLGDGLLLHFDEIGDREIANEWRNRFLLVPADEVPPAPEGEMFIHDLVGLRVEMPDGTALGTVSAFYEMAQGLMLEVQGDGREFLLPYRDEFISSIDRNARCLVVNLPEGFLE